METASDESAARFRALALPELAYLHRMARALTGIARFEGEIVLTLRSMVEMLPERLREVLVLREFGGLSYAQIAVALALPVGTVMSRLAHARDGLRRAWLAFDDGAVS